MFEPQGVEPDGPNPPQLDALDAGTTVVSLTIGGNDIGFGEIAEGCIVVNPFESPCRDKYRHGCWPQMPVGFSDVPYLRAKQRELNAMLASEAAANGATPVGWYRASIGHDACKGPLTRWVEPVVPLNPAAPIHPNLAGMRGAAKVLAAAVAAG